MSMIMPYVIPMLLGRTFDIRTDKPGIDIFPHTALQAGGPNGMKIINRRITDARYKLVDSSKEARDFLQVEGELSVKLKTGLINVDGMGSYLRDTTSRTKYVEILAKVHYETETHTLLSTTPNSDWKMNHQDVLGTHYARSVTYGGDLIASLRFTAENSADREHIKAALSAGLRAGGALDVNVKGKFEKLENDLKGRSSLEIQYFANVQVPGVATDINGLMSLINDFEKHVKLVDNGRGVPIRMELVPLSSLDSNYKNVFRQASFESYIDELESKFDDVRTTTSSFNEWATKLPSLNSAQTQLIHDFSKALRDVRHTFYNVIDQLDVSQDGSYQQFTPAFNAYAANGLDIPGKYNREFQKLKQQIEQALAKPQIGGTIRTAIPGRPQEPNPDRSGGAIQVAYQGDWAALCYTGKSHASLACAELGYGKLYLIAQSAPWYGFQNWVRANCKGQETILSECTLQKINGCTSALFVKCMDGANFGR
ncbi:uncharacterized protein LOC106160612 [Lingula anatina]|uniref:Uncharacterized protein LOC106160612 n=1 Tax=Lingula anatina TaxID=7574 RepID=A0A1S3I371_LINAN|nr:uncharacterized protein LOC106160612 [Lingula anatina]|eukprot:XP_013392717.1 uncharacterized protein LOC106160612 [Lingula anatina]